MHSFAVLATTLAAFNALTSVSGHSSIWHPSMWGFNVTSQDYPYDNRPVVPLKNMTFQQWWFHNHLDHPPNPGDFFELPAGKPATAEIACNKGATSYFASSEGGDIREPNNPNDPCPNSSSEAYHTSGLDDLRGCALAIAYKSDVKAVQPEDFTVFTVNQTCVWTRFTDFKVPERMPPCPDGGCICSFFWVHSEKSGGEENYMNGFRCNVTGSTSNVALAEPKVPRRCGADPDNLKLQAAPANCTYGAKQPFYWFNLERNNMFEGAYSPPFYNDRYNFIDGAQNDIFADSYITVPDPAPNAALPQLRTAFTSSNSSSSSSNNTIASDLVPEGTSPSAQIDTSNNSSTVLLSGSVSDATIVRATTRTGSTCGRKSTFARRSLGVDDEQAQGRKGWARSFFAMSRRSRRLTRGEKSRLWHMF